MAKTYPSHMTLGRTGLCVSRDAFGALPIQRLSKPDAVALLREAYEAGITFYDTANAYSDSEEKIGEAFGDGGMRENIVIATKTGGKTPEVVREHIALSLARMRTDYVDILQFHNIDPVPLAGSALYETMLDLKRSGTIRHIGITCHKLSNAIEAANSGLYETIQYPLSCLSTDDEIALIGLCREKGIGVIAMKAMCGGLLRSARPSLAFLRQFDNVVPIWGWQRREEMHEVLALAQDVPALDREIEATIAREKQALSGDFCRACGYCLPCPAQIDIPTAARMSLLLRRAPTKGFLSEAGQAAMARVEGCIECGACASRCPYGLDTPELLKRNYADYKTFVQR